MAMVSDFTKAPVEILVDLINHDNGTQLVSTNLEFDFPRPYIGVRNSSIVLRGAAGSSLSGEVELYYNRINLNDMVGAGNRIFALPPGASSIRDLFAQMNTRYGVRLTNGDIVDTLLDVTAGVHTVTVQAHPDSLVYVGQLTLTTTKVLDLSDAVPIPVLTGFTYLQALPVTAQDQLLALLNAQELVAQGQFSTASVTLSNARAVVGSGFNTQIDIAATNDGTFSGSNSVFYTRINLASITAGVELVSEIPFVAQQVVDGINAAMGTFLRISDLQAVSIPSMATGVPSTITLIASPDSMGFYGSGTVQVAIGLPQSANGLHQYLNVTYPSYWTAWDIAAHDLFAPPAPPPTNTAAPVVTGNRAAGGTLSCDNGTWTGAVDVYAYQWMLDGVAIAGQTNKTYVVTAGLAGHSIVCVVSAYNVTGHTAASSAAVLGAYPAPVNTAAPTISGYSAAGSTFSTTNGSWSGQVTGYTYQWYANGVAINAATASTYAAVAGDVGKTLTCTVTAVNADTNAAASSPAGIVVTPAVTGYWQIGKGTAYETACLLEADAISAFVSAYNAANGASGTYSVSAGYPTRDAQGNPVSIKLTATLNSYQVGLGTGYVGSGSTGLAACQDWIAKANAGDSAKDRVLYAPYTSNSQCAFTGSEWGSPQVLVTSQIGSGSIDSAVYSFSICSPQPAVNTVAPAITGSSAANSTLTCSAGTWTSATALTYAYQWLIDGAAIAGQVAATYTSAVSDFGHSIACRVTATNAGGAAAATAAGITVTAANVQWDPAVSGDVLISNHGLTVTLPATGAHTQENAFSFGPKSTGKYYAEFAIGNTGTSTAMSVGIAGAGAPKFGQINDGCSHVNYRNNGQIFAQSGYVGLFPTYANGDVIGVEVDLDARVISYFKNNVVVASNIAFSLDSSYRLTAWMEDSTSYATLHTQSLAYAMPVGYVAWGPDSVPVNTAAPAVSGFNGTGETLTVSNGTWTGVVDSYSYQWRSNGANIVGETAQTYVIARIYGDTLVDCVVTASNSAGSTSQASSGLSVADATPMVDTAPVVSGDATVGGTLTCSTGVWLQPQHLVFTYEWRDNGNPIAGATTNTYVPVAGDAGNLINCMVTGTNNGGSSWTQTLSNQVTVAPAATPAPTSPPAQTGTVLLAHFDGTPGDATAALDTTGRHTLTYGAGAALSSSWAAFGPTSVDLPAGGVGGAFVAITDNLSDFDFAAGDFTIEFSAQWIGVQSGWSGATILQLNNGAGTATAAFAVRLTGTGPYNLNCLAFTAAGGFSARVDGQINPGDVIKVSFERYGANTYAYLNGQLGAVVGAIGANAINSIAGQPLYIGIGVANGNNDGFNGLVDELRITKGVSLRAGAASYVLDAAAFSS